MNDMSDMIEDKKKKIGVGYYIMVMLFFAIPLLIIGYFITKNGNGAMFMPLMFVIVFGMRAIDDYIRIQLSTMKKGECQ